MSKFQHLEPHIHKSQWYDFIGSLPEPTIHILPYMWGEQWLKLKPKYPEQYAKYYCDLRIWVNNYNEEIIVLISQDNDNTSPSVLYACELVYSVIHHDPDYADIANSKILYRTRWFQSYTEHPHPVGQNINLGFCEVFFSDNRDNFFRHPHFQCISHSSFKPIASEWVAFDNTYSKYLDYGVDLPFER